MTSEVTQELLPCPFCGGEAERFTLPEDEFGNGGGDVITCSRCQASSHVEFGRKENLVDRWNTRLTAQSGDGRSGAGSHNVDANGKPTDDSDPWFQLGWYKDRLERAETERDIWKERAMSLHIASRSTALQTALEDICDPIAALRRYADERGRQLDGAVAFQLANDPNHIKGIARATLNARQSGDDEEEKAYRIGKDEGYQDAVQEIDIATGGDGEFRFCLGGDSERHCPDAETMKARILDRFAARQSGEGEREALRIIKAWLDWYRFATGDNDCQYLNGKGWDDAEALASTSMGYLAALRATDDAGGA